VVTVLAASPASTRALVHHRRHRPFGYEFSHRTTMWLVDVAHPNAAFPRWLRPLASIRAEDHLGEGDQPLPAKVAAVVAGHGLPWTAYRVLMLTNARSLGYVFDPLTTYFCLDATGRLEGVLAEVHNTYGERHCYPLSVEDGRSTADKTFYVSPFLAVEGRYDIRTRLTDGAVAVAISLTSPAGERLFTASVHGDLRATSARRSWRRVVANPVPSQRVSALIRWHGVRLWLRRLPVTPRPSRPQQETSR
jgi:DUF1365 family protein